DPHEILLQDPEPWAIPTEDYLTDLDYAFDGRPGSWDYFDGSKYRFSAAAAAIEFLRSLQKNRRVQIRKILLQEDHQAVSNPACHAQGLIPFCQENPLLRVERRVNLWRNVFLGHVWHSRQVHDPEDISPADIAWDVTAHVAEWIVEALTLISAGMPAGSFTMVLDGEPAPGRCSEIFQTILQRDVAWQSALDECYARELLPTPSSYQRRSNTCYTFEDFPQAVRDIVNNTSLVRCNFDPGEL
ncbi:hypothetical protein QBC33DRAFT_462101, partial [Phialemonium atrogriseum]